MNFIELDKPGIVDCFGFVKSVDKKSAKNGTFYLDMKLSDKDGEISAKFWDFKEEENFLPKANTVIKVRGKLQQYNGIDQLVVQRMKEVEEGEVDLKDFIESAEYTGEAMFNAILDVVNGFSDEELKNVVLSMLGENKSKMLDFPAAEKLHHAITGGLLYHTLSIVRLAECVSDIYPCVDKDLLLAGAVLHDIAKLREYEVNSAGIVTGHTVEGMLLGHLVMGAEDVGKKCDELGINPEKKYLLQHMLISHHGKLEYGAAVMPAFIEAEILSQLDMLDANMYEMAEAVGGVKSGEFTGRLWMLDNRKLYNHGRKEVKPQANVIE
ncbi:MAG: 3'-5' exoribonuclease YhaM family protein [Acutalibacteraceae bacterium]